MTGGIDNQEAELRDSTKLNGWHSRDVTEVAQLLQSDLSAGLTRAEAARRYTQVGPNSLVVSTSRSPVSILVAQFQSLIVLLLLAAVVAAFSLGEILEGAAIFVVILLNAVIGFLTEWKADRALAALRSQTVPVAHVLREGEEWEIPSSEIVPGDLVILSEGSRAPADGRITESASLQIDEAALTGESHPIEKTIEPVLDENAAIADRHCMAFMGTVIVQGRGLMLVTATGSQSEVGKIGAMIEEVADAQTPLERKLAQLGHALIGIVLVLCAVIVGAGLLSGNDFISMLRIGISLAIAAVPEGLPAVATMTLAIGMQRIARLRAIIRRLPAVETLGSTTVICTDKTGTLTKNEMTVQEIRTSESRVTVTGTGYASEGRFHLEGHPIDPASNHLLMLAMRIGTLCNDAELAQSENGLTGIGDPTELALLVAATKAGLSHDQLEQDNPRCDEVPFSSQTKYMITVHEGKDQSVVAYIKGAPGEVLRLCSFDASNGEDRELTEARREEYLVANQEMASTGQRVLALAYRKLSAGYSNNQLIQDWTFVALVGLTDPLREEAMIAVEQCQQAGIRAVMITGDQPATAKAIAKELGLDQSPDGAPLETVHGRELEGLSEAGWEEMVKRAAVFARTSPEHKMQIVTALQNQGEVVAMTGDGVNDAPALKKADIGVAMGIKGTEVAKETADMVITDDNFATIVSAVEQGRIIYSNIIRFIHYLFSCNLAEILTIFVAILLGWPLPLLAFQILWLNMVTDVLPALALALEPSAPDMMKRPPRDPSEPLMNKSFTGLIAWQGVLLASITLGAFAMGMHWYGQEGEGLKQAITIAFMTLALAQVLHVLNARSQHRSAFGSGLFQNRWLWGAILLCILLQILAVHLPFLQAVLRTAPLSLGDWAFVVGCSMLSIVVVEITKAAQTWIKRSRAVEIASTAS